MAPQNKYSKQLAEQIFGFLQSQAEPVTEKQIGRSVRGKRQYKVAALRLLLLEEKVVRAGKGCKGQPFLYSISPKHREAKS